MADETNKGIANLVPVQQGQVLNPKGRGKGTLNMSTRIRKILSSNIDWDKITVGDPGLDRLKKRYGVLAVVDALVWVQVSKAMTGDTQAFNALREAGWGRMVNVDAQAQLDVVHILKPEKLEMAQIEQTAKQLRERAERAVEGEILNAVDIPSGSSDLRPLDS